MRAKARPNKPTVCILCTLGLLCFGCSNALALDPARDLFQFSQQIWLTENGLPQNTIHRITQGADGYIWIATEEGLARFDGIKFAVFDKQNTPQLKTNDVRVLLEDRRGDLWIGTAAGLVQMRDGKFKTFTTQEGLPGNVIDSLYEDRNGGLWIATSAGMVRFDNGVVTPLTLPAFSKD